MVQGVPGTLRPRTFLTFGTTRAVGSLPYAPAAFTPREIPGTHFQGMSRLQGKWFRRREPRKKSPTTPPGIDPRTVGLVAQCPNHYATPDPRVRVRHFKAPYTLSVKLSDFTMWRHTWRKNWVNCAVLTDNSAGLRTILSSRLSHRELHSSLREFHTHSVQFFVQFFYTILHNLTQSVWGP